MSFGVIVFGGMFVFIMLAYAICEVMERFSDGNK